MRGVALSPLSRALRKPWYAMWNLLERRGYAGRAYTLHVPSGNRVYTPWFATAAPTAFAEAINEVRRSGHLGVSPDRCFVLFHLAREAARAYPDAPMAECGVYTGGTAQLLALARRDDASSISTLHLFDTFTGMPDSSDPERDYHQPGDFGDTSLEGVEQRLAPYGGCEFHPGFMPKTFHEVADVTEWSFVHIDVDIYPSVRDCLEWFWPRLATGGTIVFDDYGFYPYRHSARKAVDEFFESRREIPWPLPTGQAVATKRYESRS